MELNALTSEAVGRYTRIALQWLAAYLVTSGMISPTATWVQPAIGFAVGAATFLWTIWGHRLQAQLTEIAKTPVVEKVKVDDPDLAKAVPSPKVTT